jgi:hypothetical protein
MAKRPGRRPTLHVLSTTELQAEIRRRSRRLPALMKRRAKVLAKLSAIDADIAAAGGSGGGGGGITGRRRPQNETNLAEALAKVLKGKTMGVTEVAAAVQKAGYNTNAENFRTIVNQCLIKNRNMFKKVSRGQYTAS